MKKLIALAIIAITSSCSMMMDEIIQIGMTGHSEYYMEEWEQIESLQDISEYIRQNIKYTKDGLQHTQEPEETMAIGTGDCEDMAILYMNIANVALGIKPDAVIINWIRTIEDGGLIYNHVAVRAGGAVIDAQTGWKLESDVKYFYKYDDVFN